MKSDPMPPAVTGKRRRLKKLPQFLSEDEYAMLIRTIEADGLLKKEMADNGRGLIDAIRFAVGTGLRRGELCNLRWSAIDLKAGMITVKNTEDFQTKSGRERRVELSTRLRAAFCVRRPDIYGDETLVFPNESGGFIDQSNFRSRVFAKIVRNTLGRDRHFTPHGLRHTFATLHLSQGTNLLCPSDSLTAASRATAPVRSS